MEGWIEGKDWWELDAPVAVLGRCLSFWSVGGSVDRLLLTLEREIPAAPVDVDGLRKNGVEWEFRLCNEGTDKLASAADALRGGPEVEGLLSRCLKPSRLLELEEGCDIVFESGYVPDLEW